jgi:hypothetical protein
MVLPQLGLLFFHESRPVHLSGNHQDHRGNYKELPPNADLVLYKTCQPQTDQRRRYAEAKADHDIAGIKLAIHRLYSPTKFVIASAAKQSSAARTNSALPRRLRLLAMTKD